MTAVVIPFPVPSNPNSLTDRDLDDIIAESRTLSGSWLVDVGTSRDRAGGAEEISGLLCLRKISITEAQFAIRRGGPVIRLFAQFSAVGRMDYTPVGDFPNIAAAFGAIRHDVRIMATEWGLEATTGRHTVGCSGPVEKAAKKHRAGLKLVQ